MRTVWLWEHEAQHKQQPGGALAWAVVWGGGCRVKVHADADEAARPGSSRLEQLKVLVNRHRIQDVLNEDACMDNSKLSAVMLTSDRVWKKVQATLAAVDFCQAVVLQLPSRQPHA